MRSLIFLLLISFSRILFASECSELHMDYATDEIIELEGLSACQLRASLFLYGSSRALSKQVYQNFYECKDQKLSVNVERFRTEEISKWLVRTVQVKGAQGLEPLAFKKDVTNLDKFISDIEINNQVSCVEVTYLFSSEKRYFKCGDARLTIEVSPYVICNDSWRSL